MTKKKVDPYGLETIMLDPGLPPSAKVILTLLFLRNGEGVSSSELVKMGIMDREQRVAWAALRGVKGFVAPYGASEYSLNMDEVKENVLFPPSKKKASHEND